MISFVNPVAFLFLIPIPFLYILRSVGIFQSPSFPLILTDWHGSAFKWNGNFSKFIAILNRILLVAVYVLLVFAFADPVIHHEERVYASRGNDVLFVLDISPSMAAKDMNGGTRIAAAKNVIQTLVERNSGFSVGLVAVASESVLSVPPTSDHKTFLERLNALKIGILGEGSALGTGLSMAVYHLSTSTAPKKTIVLITDGENNAGSIHPETAAELAVAHNITIFPVGVGTKGVVPLEYIDPITEKISSGYFESSFDAAPLQKIATITGGRYFSAETVNDLSSALNVITNHERIVQTYYLKSIDEYFYDNLLIAAAIVLSVAWFLSRIVLKEVF